MKIDYVPANNYKIYQDENAFKYTTDSLILSSFARAKGKCLDLGCGTGIISLRLIDKVKSFTNIDINKRAIELINQSVQANNLEDKIKNYLLDVEGARDFFEKHSFDCVFMNPPYYNNGLRSIKESDDLARYGVDALDIFINTGADLLKDLGRIYIVVPATRMIDVFELLINKKIEVKRLRFIKTRKDDRVKLVLIEGVKFAKRGYFFEKDFLLYEGDEISKDLREVYEKIWYIFVQLQ